MKFFRTVLYLFRNALLSFRHSLSLHFVCMATIATSFLIFGACLMVFENIRDILLQARGQRHVSIFFSNDTTNEQTLTIRKEVCGRTYVESCVEITAQDAKKKFVADNPELGDVVQSVGENPFPASLEITLKPVIENRESLRRDFDSYRKRPGVEAVDDGGVWMERWLSLLSVADIAMWTLGLALGLALLFVISNTIKLIVYARRDEVQILNLVGATGLMVRTPFLIEGVLQGLAGSLVSLLLLRVLYATCFHRLGPDWSQLASDHFHFLSVTTQVWMIVGGASIGIIGSALAVGRFLKS